MEIDLEVPSHEHEKLETGPNTNDNAMISIDRIHIPDEDVISPTTSEPVEDDCGPRASERVTNGGNQAGVNTIAVDVHKGMICEPQNGLEFESKEGAYSFYREYARSVGFGITIKASRRSKKSGKFIDVKIACSRFGSKRESNTTINPRSCPKTGCNAGLHIKRRQDEKWIIYSFVKEHNHEICPDDFYQAIRGRNKQSDVVACQKKGLQLALDERDVQLMLEYFTCMQDENPNSHYAINLDHEKRLRNVFWVDAKGRHDYYNFCDVVFFDTFYVRNNYKIPYVHIIGVNNHFQFILLGCALIEDETTSTFVWVMQTWLKAVGGLAPKVIITDQDKCLNEAVADVFPNTRHCFCLWHVLSKIPTNLGCVINQYEEFMAKFNKCIYRSWTDEQFEKRWLKMIDKFELGKYEWIHSLYEDRKKWVPTYLRNTFLAGISTAERSGSITSFFDRFMKREATFKEFIGQYKSFLQYRCEMEAEADSESRNKEAGLRFLSDFEKQMLTIYTDTIFKKFQVEVLGVVSCHLQKESEEGTTIVYRVDDFEERQNFFVAWNESELDICCLCHSFEYRGFLCKHAILVLQMAGFSDIPAHYILKRWTKNPKISQTVSEISSRLHSRVQRFNDLCKRAIRLGEEGSLSQEAYDLAFQALEEALKQCVGVNNSARSISEATNILSAQGCLDIEEGKRSNSMVKSSKKRKMYKKKKVSSEPGRATMGLQDRCQQMVLLNSRVHTVNNCYIPQQDMQEMEAGSRAPTLDGYYDCHESVQGVGQLNSISPIRDGYYGNQQGIQGLGQLHSAPAHVSHYGTPQSLQGLLQGQLGFRASAMHCLDIQDSLQDMDNAPGSTPFQGTTSKHLCEKHLSR